MRSHRRSVIFGIATGRRIDTALTLMRKHGIPRPDVLISSLGTADPLRPEPRPRTTTGHAHRPPLESAQDPRHALGDLPGLKLQPQVAQTPFKISYYYDPDKAPPVDEIIALLHQEELTANVILSFGQFLDILPSRASKGQALRYVAQRWTSRWSTSWSPGARAPTRT